LVVMAICGSGKCTLVSNVIYALAWCVVSTDLSRGVSKVAAAEVYTDVLLHR